MIALKSAEESQFTLPNTISYLNAVDTNMQHIVDNSGGEILFPKDIDEVVAFYDLIGRRLGTSYSLGYVPSSPQSDGSFRKIEVKTRNNTFRTTQTPAGYYAVPWVK